MKSAEPYIIKRSQDGSKIAYRNENYWKEISHKRYDLLLRRSEIPSFYHSIDFKDYKGDISKDSIEKAMTFSKECFTEKYNYMNLYLWSEANSSQKTAIMCNIGKECVRQGKKVKFLLAGTLVDKLLKNQGFNYHADIESYLKNLKEQDMLLIDDVFDSKKSLVFNNSDMITSEWDRFLRELCASGIKIVMTSNISINNIEKKYGKSLQELVSRNFYPLEFKDSIAAHRKKMFANIFDKE